MKKAFIRLHLAIFLAGFTGVFGKLITLSEGLITWYRLFLSGSLFWLLLVLTGKLKKTTIRDFLRMGSSGFLLGLHWVFFYGSIKYSNVSVGVVCFSLTGFFTALLEPVINRGRLSVGNLLLSSIALCGIALIFHFDTRYRTGIILGAASSIMASLFTISNKRLARQYDTTSITLYQMLGGFTGLSIVLPLYLAATSASFALPSAVDLAYLLLLSVFCTILLYMFITQALRKISAFTVNLSFNLESIYSIIMAMILFKENRELTLAFYAGLTLILLSVILTTFKRQ